MALKVYDFRNDEHLCQMLVTPQIRCRFMEVPVGQEHGAPHSHDLGHEIFLILQGQCEFVISGQKAVLGPGQLCVALVDEPHTIRNVGDEKVIMYLSVTPHIQPTHTDRQDDGSPKPPRFAPSESYGIETDATTPADQLVDGFVSAAAEYSRAQREIADRQAELAAQLKAALAAEDREQVTACRDQLWDGVRSGFEQIHALGYLWNTLGPRISYFD